MVHWVPRSLYQAIALAVAALGVVGCATPDTRTPEERTSDRAIVSRVEAALHADSFLNTDHVTVQADRGVVRLSGEVADDIDLRDVLHICAAVPGVRNVDDQLEITDFSRFRR